MSIKITDLSPYFKKDGDTWIFTGKKLEVWIPKIYQERGLLVIGETLVSLGIFQLRINDTYHANLLLLNRLNINFSSYRNESESDYPYLVFEIIPDTPFILSSTIVKDGNIIYDVFVTFLALGKIPPFLDYDIIQCLFDNDYKHCDISLGINHTIFEMIYASVFRDSDDPYTFYRHTLMNKPPKIVSIHQISHGPVSTTARIVGSYLSEGMTSALVDDNQHVSSKIENLLRS